MKYLLAALALSTSFVFAGLMIYILQKSKNQLLSTLQMILYSNVVIAGIASSYMFLTASEKVAMLAFKVIVLTYVIIPAVESQILVVRATGANYMNSWKRRMTFYSVPVVLSIINLLGDNSLIGTDIVYTSVGWGIENRLDNPWYWVYMVYMPVYVWRGMYWVLNKGSKSNNMTLKTRTNKLLMVIVIAMIPVALMDLTLPILVGNIPVLAPLIFLVPGLILLFLYMKNDLGMSVADTGLEEIIDSMLDLFIMTDVSGRIVKYNQRALNQLGMSQGDYIGKGILTTPFADVFSPRLLKWLTTVGQYKHVEVELMNGAGDILHMLVNASVMEDRFQGRIGYLFLLSDITTRKEMEKDLMASFEEERQLAEVLFRKAHYDVLTDIPNRRYFFDEIEKRAAVYDVSGKDFVLVFIDLNGFKKVNDDYGHDFGDVVLVTCTTRLQFFDDAYGMLARIGGDEFVIVIDMDNDEMDINGLMVAIADEIAKPMKIMGQILTVTASMGYARYSQEGSLDQIIKAADMKMYQNKTAGL